MVSAGLPNGASVCSSERVQLQLCRRSRASTLVADHGAGARSDVFEKVLDPSSVLCLPPFRAPS